MSRWLLTMKSKYKKYQNVPLPKIVDAKYSIDLFPYERNVDSESRL